MQLLSDPLRDRTLPQLSPPPHRPLLHHICFKNGLPNWQLIRDHIYKEGRVTRQDFIQLINTASSILANQDSCLMLDSPITVVGDIHGQYYDLMRIIQMGGCPSKNKYLFLGDYVDRGAFSIQNVILLVSIKIALPNQIFLLRGNHECRQMTSYFNFREECLHKYDQDIYQRIMDLFDCLPLAAVIDNNYFAVHGGLSPELLSVQQLRTLQRKHEPKKAGLICDLLWSDPCQKQQDQEEQFSYNETRGCAYFFSKKGVEQFLQNNRLKTVIRAHEAQLEGYKYHWREGKEMPLAITVFSAPNYCDVYNNKGAVCSIKGRNLNLKQFIYSPHPFLLPNFMNVFSWSIPFVAQKVCQMFLHLFKGIDQSRNDGLPQQKQRLMRNRVKSITKMLKMHKAKRGESEKIMKLGGLCPDNKISTQVLLSSRQFFESVIGKFQLAQNQDKVNEKVPY